jgi:hypothetical protein
VDSCSTRWAGSTSSKARTITLRARRRPRAVEQAWRSGRHGPLLLVEQELKWRRAMSLRGRRNHRLRL